MNRKIAVLLGIVSMCLLVSAACPAGAGMPSDKMKLAEAMYRAVSKADINMLTALIDKGASVNTTLTDAGLKPGETFGALVDDLVKTDADVEHWPLLMWTVYLRSEKMTRMLLKAGAVVNTADTSGATPLHWAAWSGNYPLVKLLLGYGANPKILDNSGRAPLDWAIKTGQVDIIRLLEQPLAHKVTDSDGDGVPDYRDQCPNTPKGVKVDERGCWVAAYSNFFGYDQWQVRKEFYPYLQNAAKVLGDNPHLQVEIVGHTDSHGTEAYNLELGRKRAEAVRALLIKFGVKPERLLYKSMGESQPLASNDTAAGRAKNRRVEIHVRETK
ncbi:MAG: ankyrin repeat domain-containing protein [Pseudomonadota bacterium]